MDHERRVARNIARLGRDTALQERSVEWVKETARLEYCYNFSWLSRPIIQYPQDVVAMQELIWELKPDLIIETGIAHGGSLVFSASMLALIDLADAVRAGVPLNPRESNRLVLGIDIDIRAHNRAAIESHPMASRISMIQGSSIDTDVISRVREIARDYDRVMVCLDSMHTHHHVLAELEAYAPLVSKGSYCCVFDTIIEDLPAGMFRDRPWEKGNNPKTAVWEFLSNHPEFEVDRAVQDKTLITVAPDGYLRRCF